MTLRLMDEGESPFHLRSPKYNLFIGILNELYHKMELLGGFFWIFEHCRFGYAKETFGGVYAQ